LAQAILKPSPNSQPLIYPSAGRVTPVISCFFAWIFAFFLDIDLPSRAFFNPPFPRLAINTKEKELIGVNKDRRQQIIVNSFMFVPK